SGGRRHTSFSRDWSSDVCSSDLPPPAAPPSPPGGGPRGPPATLRRSAPSRATPCPPPRPAAGGGGAAAAPPSAWGSALPRPFRRSEERRVGKGRRSRGTATH